MLQPHSDYVEEFRAKKPKTTTAENAIARLRAGKKVHALHVGLDRIVILENIEDYETHEKEIPIFFAHYTPKVELDKYPSQGD